jgi:uncharacterized protein YecE (DUF72 family)
VRLSVGTSGYSYKEWKGPFYPEDLPAKKMLEFYAERLPAVEINNTFYRMPKRTVLETWAGQVPDGFRFAIKASRRITHFKRLKDVAEETSYLLSTVSALGDRLGILLFQLPPNLKADRERLATFLELLPDKTPTALEFRHPSWFEHEIFETLRDRGAALCCADVQDEPAPEILATGSRGYLRLRRSDYETGDLEAWAERIRAQPWDEAFVFFKHETEGAGPAFASRFLEAAQRDS